MTSSSGMDANIIPEPYTGLGAQQLLQHHPPRHTGFLRKRGKRERMLESFRLTRSLLGRVLRWRQRFVVISQGCIYCYVSETATKPLQAFSLIGYNRLLSMDEEPTNRWTFSITSPDPTAKIHFFACVSDVDRMTWMRAIREEMVQANNIKDDCFSAGSLASNSSSKDVYVILQKPIFEPPESDSEEDSEEDDEAEDDSDYDQINDLDLDKARRPRIPLPPTPDDPGYKAPTTEVQKAPAKLPPPKPHKANSEKHTYINSPKGPKTNSLPAHATSSAAKSAVPKPNPKPVPKSAAIPAQQPPKPTLKVKPESAPVPDEKEYFFPENNRDKALSILREQKDQGTYLVRMSRSNDQKVLSVMTENDVIKEYKIMQKEKKVTINNRDFYKSVGDLLVAYKGKPLPNRTTSLGRAYSSTDLRI
ncbi:SH3 domain-binding protein 2-like isoform X2 [Haliotis rubra]|uniref:SH3 domain-binding protein 2-like isoform X2 n=1 Tax=Haliotis rubra TaxID=36100 RepID=UPI001EE52151|nr:SH3 domain-binding protein 2-like isoform X2 [Haliotis rubra]